MSPEYFWLRTETVLVKMLGKMPISAKVCIRCNASPLARCERLLNHEEPGEIVEEGLLTSSPMASSSLMRKGTT